MSEDLLKKMNDLMYYLIKGAARDSWSDFIAYLDISDNDYELIKKELAKIGITRTYI